MLHNNDIIGGRYRILRQIKEGGMSYIYLCRDEMTGRELAVKEAKSDDGEVKQSLIAEAKILTQLSHKSLVKIIEVIQERGRFLIVMEYVPGPSLKDYLDEKRIPSEAEIINWGMQLCDVLYYLHTRQPAIIYRDLKPANIVLRPDGSLCLIDFGTAREYKVDRTKDTVNLGTKGYAAPEQYGTGQGQSDPRTDIYTLGATLFHLATGRYPLDVPAEFPLVRKLNPKISEDLEHLIAKCAQTNADSRYQNCMDIYMELSEIQGSSRRNGLLYLSGFAACLMIGVVSMVIAMQSAFSNVILDILGIAMIAAGTFFGVKFLRGSLGRKPREQYHALVENHSMDVGSGVIGGDGTGSMRLGDPNAKGLIIEDELVYLASSEVIVL